MIKTGPNEYKFLYQYGRAIFKTSKLKTIIDEIPDLKMANNVGIKLFGKFYKLADSLDQAKENLMLARKDVLASRKNLPKKFPNLFKKLKQSYKTGKIRSVLALASAIFTTARLIGALIIALLVLGSIGMYLGNTFGPFGILLGLITGMIFGKMFQPYVEFEAKNIDKIEAWLNKHKKEQASLVVTKRLELAYMGT